MALEDSMNNLAEAMNKYAAVMTRHCDLTERALKAGGTVAATPDTTPATTEAATTEKKGRGRPKKTDTKPAETETTADDADTFGEEEVDPFGDDAPAATPKLDAKVIRGLVMRVKEEKGEAIALKLIASVGAETLGTIPADKYQKVVDNAAKVGITL